MTPQDENDPREPGHLADLSEMARVAEAYVRQIKEIHAQVTSQADQVGGHERQAQAAAKGAMAIEQALAGHALSSRFDAGATRAQKESYAWYTAAIISAGFATYAAWQLAAGQLEGGWESVISQLGITGILVSFSAFCGRRGVALTNRHDDLRDVAMQLHVLDSYVRELPDLDRHALRAKLADRFFIPLTTGRGHGRSPPPKGGHEAGTEHAPPPRR